MGVGNAAGRRRKHATSRPDPDRAAVSRRHPRGPSGRCSRRGRCRSRLRRPAPGWHGRQPGDLLGTGGPGCRAATRHLAPQLASALRRSPAPHGGSRRSGWCVELRARGRASSHPSRDAFAFLPLVRRSRARDHTACQSRPHSSACRLVASPCREWGGVGSRGAAPRSRGGGAGTGDRCGPRRSPGAAFGRGFLEPPGHRRRRAGPPAHAYAPGNGRDRGAFRHQSARPPRGRGRVAIPTRTASARAARDQRGLARAPGRRAVVRRAGVRGRVAAAGFRPQPGGSAGC